MQITLKEIYIRDLVKGYIKNNNMTNNELLEKYYDFLLGLQEKFGVSDDCMQMIYLELLQYSNRKLNKLDRKGDMEY